MWVGRWVTGGISIACLIIMVVMARQHKRRLNSMLYMNGNVIYTDRVNQPNPVNQVQPQIQVLPNQGQNQI